MIALYYYTKIKPERRALIEYEQQKYQLYLSIKGIFSSSVYSILAVTDPLASLIRSKNIAKENAYTCMLKNWFI